MSTSRFFVPLTLFLLAGASAAPAQYVTNVIGVNINATTNRIFPATGTGPGQETKNFFTFTVSGLEPSIVDLDFRLSVLHSAVGDLDVYLISPGGLTMALTNITVFSAGGVGNNFQDTYFDEEGGAGRIGSPGFDIAPFAGPEWGGVKYKTQFATDTLAKFNGIDPNGTWTLRIDEFDPLDDGYLLWAGADSLALDNFISSGSADGTGWSSSVIGTQLIITTPIPEPATVQLALIGAVGLLLASRRFFRR
jgi:subtilisin-like proprotein convertase family protein